LRRSRTSSGNARVRSASRSDRRERTSTLGGLPDQAWPSESGPSPYSRRAQREPDAPRYEVSCRTARSASALPRILPFTSTRSGFPTNGSKTSDHTAKSAPTSRVGDITTTSAPDERSASATTCSMDCQSLDASERSKTASRSSALVPSPTNGVDPVVGLLFGRSGADSSWSRANPIASWLSGSIRRTRN